jgi:CBS domain-containing protein
MSVGEILKNKGTGVETIKSDATVAEAIEQLRDERIGALVVSPDGESIEGVFSERDVISGLADHREGLLEMKVSDLMTTDVTTCSLEDSAEQIMLKMTELRARHFPVLDEERLVGIVSIGDLVKHRLDEVELENRVLRDSYIASR